MKKLLLTSALFILGFVAFAQGELQFNQVKNITMVATGVGSNRPTTTLSVTVPAGKVWKIESAHISTTTSSNPNSYFLTSGGSTTSYVLIDKGIVGVADGSGHMGQSPVWLAAGAHTIILQGYANSSSTYEWNALITGIEFNVIP